MPSWGGGSAVPRWESASQGHRWTRALIIHAAAPLIFAVVSASYFSGFGYLGALTTAAGFLSVVIAMDAIVVALLIQHEFTMFKSILGTWLPFVLIFTSTYVVGRLMGAS